MWNGHVGLKCLVKWMDGRKLRKVWNFWQRQNENFQENFIAGKI